jgi:hypothetical protein
MNIEEVRREVDLAIIENKKAEVHAGLLVLILFSSLAAYLYFF